MANSLISNAFHQISRELRLPAIIWFPRSSICKMDLLAVRTIPFLRGNVVTRLRVSPCWHRNGLARSDSVLAYGHRAWPASIRLAYGQRGLPPYCTGQTSGRTTGETRWNIMPRCRLCCIKINRLSGRLDDTYWVRILFFEGHVRTCTLTYSILAYVNKNRIRCNYNRVSLVKLKQLKRR